jgi:hypothetical protein
VTLGVENGHLGRNTGRNDRDGSHMNMRAVPKLEPVRLGPWLVAALGLHVGVLAVFSLAPPKPNHPSPRNPDAVVNVEIALVAAVPTEVPAGVPVLDVASQSVRATAGLREGRAGQSGGQSGAAQAPVPAAEGDTITGELLVSNTPAPAGSAGVQAREPARVINLGLDGSIRDQELLAYRANPPPAPSERHSVGLLREGLDVLDAEHGMSRSGAALNASYMAARRAAPQQGIGVFDILSDDRGVVISVNLVRSGPDEQSWREVGTRLHEALKGRTFRVPPNGKGLLTRLRISRGDYAVSLKERGKADRVVAIGQDLPSSNHDESTHAAEESNALVPTLGVTMGPGQ